MTLKNYYWLRNFLLILLLVFFTGCANQQHSRNHLNERYVQQETSIVEVPDHEASNVRGGNWGKVSQVGLNGLKGSYIYAKTILRNPRVRDMGRAIRDGIAGNAAYDALKSRFKRVDPNAHYYSGQCQVTPR